MTSAYSEKTGYENHVTDRNLAMELVRVTEAAAIAASPWVGYGDKNKADGAAVEAFRAAGAQGIVSAGFAPGFVTPAEGEALREAVAAGVVAAQSTRSGSGRVFPTMGLREAGFVPADNLTPQKARILLALALTVTRDPREIGVLAHEPRHVPGAQPQHVLPHEHLPGSHVPRADAHGGDLQRVLHRGSGVRGHHLQHHGEAPGVLDGAGVPEQLFGGPAARSDIESNALSMAGTAEPSIRSTVGDTGTHTVAKGQVTQQILAAPEGDGRDAQAAIGG